MTGSGFGANKSGRGMSADVISPFAALLLIVASIFGQTRSSRTTGTTASPSATNQRVA